MPKRSPKNKPSALRRLLPLLLALPAAASQACWAPPQGQLIAADELVRQATDVAVGQVISATPLNDYETEYRLIVLDQLAGPARKLITVTGGPAHNADKDGTFDDHKDFRFWARGGGRTMNGSDCVIHPGFAIGASYLVFQGAPSTWRNFERIGMVGGTVNQDDQWLAYVKARLAKREASMTATPDTPPDYERVGRFIYGFHRIVARDALERKTLAAQHAPNELLLRAGALADEFDHIVQRSARVPDAEIDATLREAAAVQAALAAWRGDAGARPGSPS